jgi:AP-1 complex subunit gamma-1
MELCLALITQQNYKTMSKELITFLETAEPEFKSQCSSSMVMAAERFAPGKRAHVDTLMDVLRTAGNYVRDDVIFNTIQGGIHMSEIRKVPFPFRSIWFSTLLK